jgi:glycerol-3-phosphate acyltransferase PlsY
MEFILFPLIAYLLGSIPTAVWIGKCHFGIDVREYGSKNAGATNTFRVLGKKPGIIVLIIDILKGVVATSLPLYCFTNHLFFQSNTSLDHVEISAAIGAVIGHVFPVFARFKGGKGVATSLGVIIGFEPVAATICLVIFLSVFWVSHYVSLGAMIASLAFPFVLKCIVGETSEWHVGFSILLSFMVILTHKKNIVRLMHGEENKMHLFKKNKKV